jgi:hypothetical protein
MIEHTYISSNLKKLIKNPSLIFNSFFLSELKSIIEAWFNPRQKWLTQTIPNTWCDKTTLIPHLLFECLVHYVEQEKGLQDQLDWSQDLKEGYVTQQYVEGIVKRDAELRKAYNYIKFERPELEYQLENSYPETNREIFVINEDGHTVMRSCKDLYGMPYEQAYAQTNRLEKFIAKKDMMTMKTIIKYHEFLWT